MLDIYPFDREKSSMMTMYAVSDSKYLQYMNRGIKTIRERESANITIGANERWR